MVSSFAGQKWETPILARLLCSFTGESDGHVANWCPFGRDSDARDFRHEVVRLHRACDVRGDAWLRATRVRMGTARAPDRGAARGGTTGSPHEGRSSRIAGRSRPTLSGPNRRLGR